MAYKTALLSVPIEHAAMARRRWSDELAPDVLREIAGRLHVAADFVRFHAVCKPWRDSRDPLSGTATTTTATNRFLPWLLASAGKHHDVPLKLRCVFSKSSYRASSSAPPRRSWVASSDGDTLRYLTVDVIRPRLHDPLTGAVTELPIFPPTHNLNNESWGENSYGTIYRDGTTLLYTVFVVHGGRTRFRAALLRPGETNKWTYVDRIIPTRQGEFCVAYHGGRIFVTVEASLWRVVAPDGGCDDVLFRSPWMPGEHDTDDSEQYNYVLESHGQLLWVSVRLRYTYQYPIGSHHAHTLSVSVHALQESSSSTPKKMRWIRKDGRSLADRVLFLGSPNSFTIDAASLPGCRRHGGCAYFVYHNTRASSRPFELFGVFRYDLVEGKSEFIERLPPEWDNEKCTWLIPQPIIAPLQEINERKMDAPKLKNLEQHKTVTVTSPTHVINIERHYEPSFKVLVRNLPHSVDKFQLECFFDKHGKVSNSEIIYDKNTKTSDGKGIVTMTTMHVHQEDAIAALQGLVLDGCRLDVILVNDRPRPRR